MSQPNFWLKITPAYVIENFEELLKYVAAYDYSPKENPESDFNSTANFLSDVARNIVRQASECNLEDTPAWEPGGKKALRIVAAAVLTEYKRGVTDHYLIIGLLRLLLHSYTLPTDHCMGYIGLINACARRLPLADNTIFYGDLEPNLFSEATLCSRLAYLKWENDNVRAYYESAGTVLFDDSGMEFVPMNHDNVLLTDRKRRKSIEAARLLRITDVNPLRPSKQNVQEMFDWISGLICDMQNVKPSRERKPKRYAVGDNMDVKVVKLNGIRVECETFDPDFMKVRGKLLLDSVNLGVPRDNLLSFLKVGDILSAIYLDGPEFTFRIDNEEEVQFKNDLGSRDAYMCAVFQSEYRFGTRWLAENGLTINIINQYNSLINYEEHVHKGGCVKVHMTDTRTDGSGNVVCNGKFLPESEQYLEDVDEDIFRRNAADNMARALIEFLKSAYSDMPAAAQEDCRMKDDSAVTALGMLMLHYGVNDRELPTMERLSYLIMAYAAFECARDERNALLVRREVSFLKALCDFAMGENPASIRFSLPEGTADYERSRNESHMVDILRSYKESDRTIMAPEYLRGDQTGLVEQLVKASNTLIGKIESAELSRIKKTIASKLGVADMFRDTAASRTFYGFESDTLEFKVSCVLPPMNLRSGSEDEDRRIQTFVILKTVCAFLNSPSGGELLIGVNDEGYAVGIRNDIDALSLCHLIPEPNPDRLRVYIKNIIDRAFISNDGNAAGNAITAGNVLVNIEQTKENRYILRVKINPYPYDVVKIQKDYVIAGFKNVFFRSSATSMPLDAAGIRNVRLQKIRSLDANESKIAMILEAIDKKRQLRICDYRSRSGSVTRRVEPHILMMDNSAFQAYDHSCRQMRLFKVARTGEIEILPTAWESERRHKTRPVDVFGTMQSDEFKGETRKVKMSDYALMLLYEEFPLSKGSDHISVAENMESDRMEYPWLLELNVYNPDGYMRFFRGLPDDIIPAG